METLVTFVIIDYVRTINSTVGSIQISQAISLIMKSYLVSRNDASVKIHFNIARVPVPEINDVFLTNRLIYSYPDLVKNNVSLQCR